MASRNLNASTVGDPLMAGTAGGIGGGTGGGNLLGMRMIGAFSLGSQGTAPDQELAASSFPTPTVGGALRGAVNDGTGGSRMGGNPKTDGVVSTIVVVVLVVVGRCYLFRYCLDARARLGPTLLCILRPSSCPPWNTPGGSSRCGPSRIPLVDPATQTQTRPWCTEVEATTLFERAEGRHVANIAADPRC